MQKEIDTIKNFYSKEQNLITYLQYRWFEEREYENFEEYKELVKEKANKYNLHVSDLKFDDDLSIKITFDFDNNKKITLNC